MGGLISLPDLVIYRPDRVPKEDVYEELLAGNIESLEFLKQERLFLIFHRLLLMAERNQHTGVKEILVEYVLQSNWCNNLIHMFADFTFISHLNLHKFKFQEESQQNKRAIQEIIEQMMGAKTPDDFPVAPLYSQQDLAPLVNILKLTEQDISTDDKDVDGLFWLNIYCRHHPECVNQLHSKLGLSALHIVSSTFGLPSAELNFNLQAIELLVEQGADVNLTDRYGATALHYAAAGGFTDACKLLLELNANPEIKDENGRTAGDLALVYGHLEDAAICSIYDITNYGHHDCKICDTERQKLLNTTEITKSKCIDDIQKCKATSQESQGQHIGYFEKYSKVRVKHPPNIDTFQGLLATTYNVINVPTEEDTNLMLTHIQHSKLGFQNKLLLSEEKVLIRQGICELVSTVIKGIQERIKPDGYLLDDRPLITGSSVQGGKVGLPDEFDLNVMISLTGKALISINLDYPGFCFVRSASDTRYVLVLHTLKVPFRYLFGLEINKLYQADWTDTTGHLSIAFSSTAQMFPRERSEGHLYELNLYWDSGLFKHLQIKVDIAATITAPKVDEGTLFKYFLANADLNMVKPASSISMDNSSQNQPHALGYTEPVQEMIYCLPFYKNKLGDSSTQGRLCLVSYSREENELFDGMSPKLKECYGTIKSLQYLTKNVTTGKGSGFSEGDFPSYYLKQILFDREQLFKDCSKEAEDMELVDLVNLVLRKLENHLRTQELMCYFNPSNNLLSNVKNSSDQQQREYKLIMMLKHVVALRAITDASNTSKTEPENFIPVEDFRFEFERNSRARHNTKLANFDESSL